MRVINLFAGPGAGKSTIAAGLFYRMKKLGLNVELVTEYAKEKVWENSIEVLNDQLYVTAQQNRRLSRLQGKVDYVITDSPLLLGAYYSRKYGTDILEVANFIETLFDSYDNTNIFIKRTKEFKKGGRLGSYESAVKADDAILDMLEQRRVFLYLKDDQHILDEILAYVL